MDLDPLHKVKEDSILSWRDLVSLLQDLILPASFWYMKHQIKVKEDLHDILTLVEFMIIYVACNHLIIVAVIC